VIIDTPVLTGAQSNCGIVGGERAHRALAIDPGDNADPISRRLIEVELELKLVVITNAYRDHVNAAGELLTHYGTPVARSDMHM
jgi:hydroxyacylglutathione hydrolase